MEKLKIGTCSWKYDSWRGLIYSQNKKINYLKEYSKYYNTVEIDQWFWSLYANGKITLPKPSDVIAYNSSTPNNFNFTIKVPNSITLTHPYSQTKKELPKQNEFFLSIDLFKTFLNSISELENKTGILIFQFEYLNKQKMKSQFDFEGLFSDFIKKCPDNYNYAIEIRNPNYINENYFEFLVENNLSHIFLEGYYMPNIFDIYKKFGKYITEKAVIRLLGNNRKGIEQKSNGNWNKIIESKDADLAKIVEMIRDLLRKKVDIFINVNNHYEGSAPLTIKKIKNMLSQL